MAIAQVGALGAYTVGGAFSVQPPFGQATTAGNLLVAWLAPGGAGPAGWTQAVTVFNNVQPAIWYKPNCSSSETAPTFTLSSNPFGINMQGMVAEFSGADTSPLSGTVGTSGATSPLVATASPADAIAKALIATFTVDSLSKAGTATLTDTYTDSGGAQPTTVVAHTDASTSLVFHFICTYAIGTSATTGTADSVSHADSSMNISTMSTVLASFVPPAPPPAVPVASSLILSQACNRAANY